MKRAPNLDEGNPAAKPQNSPSALPRQKRANLVQTKPTSKAKNRLAPYAPNKEAQTYRKNPSTTAPRMSSDDGRIRSEILSRSHPVHHSRKGR